MKNILVTLTATILFSLCANAQSETVFGAVDVYSDVEVLITVADKHYTVTAGDLQGIKLYAKTNTLLIVPTDGKGGGYKKRINLERKGERANLIINILERRQELLRSSNMVLIPGGRFLMGSTEGRSIEKHVHLVILNDFYLGRTEIKVAEFADFIEATAYKTTAEQKGFSYAFGQENFFGIKKGTNWRCDHEGEPRPKTEYNHPVIHVSWYDAVAYCNWLSGEHGLKAVYLISGTTVVPDWSANGYRLPTEAEWEYAASSGEENEEWAGTSIEKELGQFANCSGSADGYETTAPVGMLRSNKFGLADMSGNVWEWCGDWYDRTYYEESPGINPRGPASGSSRVVRGGSWESDPMPCRTFFRDARMGVSKKYDVGFRLARNF